MKTLSLIGSVSRVSALIAALLCPGTAAEAAQELPPLPKGVADLKFIDFFVMPIGPRGLELTEKVKALDGKRVRILGHMVRQEEAQVGSFLFTSVPVQLHDHDSALADDLPPTTVRVIVPSDRPITYTPQLLLLTGMLTTGNREEPDGRISFVRLTLDASAISKPKAGQRWDSRSSSLHTRGGASDLMK